MNVSYVKLEVMEETAVATATTATTKHSLSVGILFF
jgi:hypothetical protein